MQVVPGSKTLGEILQGEGGLSKFLYEKSEIKRKRKVRMVWWMSSHLPPVSGHMTMLTVACAHGADACVHAVFGRLLRGLVSERTAIDES